IQRFFPNHFIIATDGSKSVKSVHCLTSIAGFSCLQQFCYRIHPLNSVFTAEVLPICQALDELVIPETDILILSDSFSALSSLKNKYTQSNIFANHFSTQTTEVQPIPIDYDSGNESLNRNIEFWELKRAIQKTKNSTPGADNIPAIWFKNLDDASLYKILFMFQQQLDFSVLPKKLETRYYYSNS
ncbi:hypothetical protein AVEN_210671-1, partial [Araneus ventricosus]